MSTQKIYLVDDHPMIRQGYASLIETTDDLAVCGEAAEGEAALGAIPEADPDLVVVDMNLPGMPGLDVVRQLAARSHADDARAAGARGYLEKQRAASELLGTIREILGVPAR